jgi:hypothetical protein
MRTPGWLLAAALLGSCGGGLEIDDDSSQLPVAIEVYKSRNATQCANTAVPMDVLQGQLTAAGVPVLASSCGYDGLAYVAVCGAPNGSIGIFQIDPSRLAAAQAAGFAPLSTLPNAVKQPCA